MNMQDFTGTGHMDAVHETANQSGTAESKYADCASQVTDHIASLKDESILCPNLTVEAWLESEIDVAISEVPRSDQSYDDGDNLFKDIRLKFVSEPKENQEAVAELRENCQFEVDQRIGIEESEKESVHGPHYNGENGNNVPVLSVSDSVKPFESHPFLSISDTSVPALSNVKPETDLGVEELFEDSENKLLPEPHENHIAIAEQWNTGHVEVDHGFGTEESGIKSDCELPFTENGDNFPVLSVNDCFLERKESYQHVDDSKKPVELLPSSSIPDTPICVKPEIVIDEMPGQSSENVPVTDVLGRGEAEDVAFPRNGTDEAQLLENLTPDSKEIDVLAVERVENASHISKDKLLDINSCVANTTFTINVQPAEIQNSVSGQAKFLSPENTAIWETKTHECVEVDDYPCNDIPETELAHGILNSEGEVTTFHTDDPDTKNEDVTVIVENNDIPTEVVDRKSDFNNEISSGIGGSNASSVDVLSSEGDFSVSPIIDCEESNVASSETSDADYIVEQDMGSEYLVKPFFLVKMPNFDDLIVRERVRRAQLLVDERTRLVDSLRFKIEKYKENCRADAIVYEAVMSEARALKRAVKSQRAEIDSLQSVMNKVKNALAVEDIDDRIEDIKHIIEHETIPSELEDLFTREIKQLNQLREQLSSNLGDLVELQLALNNRDQIEGRLQVLRKELNGLKDSALKAEALAQAVEHRCKGEIRKLKEAQAQFRAADNVREEAYKHMQSLKREMHEKNQRFHKYKVDASVAYNNAAKREIQALNNLCFNQVESTMELWNKNPDFRKEYVRCNMRSTVKRLGTFDGRSLGPDEQPVLLSSYVYRSVDGHANPTELSIDDGAFSGYDVASDNVEEEQLPNKEELEQARKDGERSKALTETDLREQRRLEEKSKALEALMRKKKIAEKAQTRAELRAQKEAELKEKEREKRLRKKERRKSFASEASDANNSGDTITRYPETTETMNESDTTTTTAAKRTGQKASQSVKQSKTKAIPPSVRNRSRKKLQQWIWVMVTCMVVILVFLVGNIGFFNGLSDSFKRSTTIA